MLPKLKKLISLILSLLFIIQQSGLAQNIGGVDVSKYLGSKPPVSSPADTFRPVHLRYLSYDSLNNSFKLLLDQGSHQPHSKPLPAGQAGASEQVTRELLKYFFIGLTLPNSSFWVNLRPDAPDNIIDDDLAKTDIGKILLEADLNLKKDTSNWTSPQTPEGKAYWDKLYRKAGELYGTENITIPTLTRPWIVPDEIILRESPEGAYIYKATLKVMLEEDYLSRGRSRTAPTMRTAPTYQQYTFSDPRLKELNEYSTQLIKETIIPKLTREINSSRRYAQLRQVYYSLILAQNFKKKLTNKSGPYSNLIDSRDLTNLTSPEPWDKRTYFKEYQKSFQEGEYKLKANQSTIYGQVIRRYMSGGLSLNETSSAIEGVPGKGGPPYGVIKNMLSYEITASSSAEPYNMIANPLSVSAPGAGKAPDKPMILYVPDPRYLAFNDPEIKKIWDNQVLENINLHKFSQKLASLSREYGIINNFPWDELNNLFKSYSSLDKERKEHEIYNLGFITFNSGIGEGSGSRLAARFKFNLMFLASIADTKINPADIFNKKGKGIRLSDENAEKIASGRGVKEGEELNDLWRFFKATSNFIWTGLSKDKVDNFFNKFEDLLDIFQQERKPYYKIAGLKHSQEPHIVILKQYEDQLEGLVNSDFPREWIERQELVGPNTPGGKIGNIEDFPDPRLPGEAQGKVRKFRLPDGREVYAKRVNPLRARYPEEEIMISLEVDKSLKKISPYFGVQEFIGIVYDQGAFYLLSLAITGEKYPPDKEQTNDLNQFRAEVEKILMPLGLGDIEHIFIYKNGKIHCVFLDFETLPYRSVKEENKAPEALKNNSPSGNNREKANEYTISQGARNIVSSATYSDSDELIFRGFEGKPKAEILKEIIGSLQQKVKEIEEEGKRIRVENEEVNIFERYKAFKRAIGKNILNDPELIKKEIKKFGELLGEFSAKVMNIVKNNNEEKVLFSETNVSIFYDLRDKLNKARVYPYYIEYGAKVDSFIRVMDAYIKLLSDIQNPEKIKEGYAKGMLESRGEPELTYRLLKEYNKLPQEKKPSAIPEETKEADLEEILKTFSLNSPDWLGESLKNKIAEDYGGLSVLEPIITDQYGQSNDVSRLSDETMNKLKARLNKEEANEYFYLPIITKHWIKVLTYQYWVNSYNYKVVIAKKSALEKSLNYTYRNIVKGNDDVLLLREFSVRPGNKPPTIILEQQGFYKELRGQGFISKAYPLFVQSLAEKFPGWQVEGVFENLEKHKTPPALALFKEYFLEPQLLYAGQGKSTPGYTESAIWKAKIPSLNSSSSLVDNPGGVDLRALPITTQSLNHPLMTNMPLSGSAVSLDINLGNELIQIQDMLKAGIMPSSERIREYALASSSLKPEDYSREIDRLFSCIADIFRLEEEKAKPTPQALKDALILLESDMAA